MSAKRPSVFLTRRLPPGVMKRLEAETELRWNQEDRVVSAQELAEAVVDCEALLSLVTDRVDDALLGKAARLRVVANVAVGYDNIDVDAATRRGVAVTNTPGVLTETTADLAWALLLAVSRRIVEGDRLVRSGDWSGWAPTQLLGRDVHGATLGIVGLGRIGRSVARRARGFDMRVLYWNRTRLDPVEERELGVEYRSLGSLLAESDFVTIHVAATEETHHLIDAEALGSMQPHAGLINTARGTVVDEAALVTALREGRLASAGLDVYEREPIVTPALFEMPRVVLLPHLGSASEATRERMGEMALDNALAACRGERPPNLVDPSVGGRFADPRPEDE